MAYEPKPAGALTVARVVGEKASRARQHQCRPRREALQP